MTFRYIFLASGKFMLDQAKLKEQVERIEAKREFLVKLLEQPDLGVLRLDVNQALEELDELIEEFQQVLGKS